MAEQSRRPSVLKAARGGVSRRRCCGRELSPRSSHKDRRICGQKLGDELIRSEMAWKNSLRGSPNATERAEPNASERGASRVPDRQAHGCDVVASIRSLRARIPTTAVVIHLRQLMPSSVCPREPSRSQRIPPSPSSWQVAPAQARSFGLKL